MNANLGAGSIIIGAILVFSFGIWPESLTFLLVVMGVDYISGVAASLREGKGLSSTAGFWGLGKKGLMLLVVLVAHRVDVLLHVDMAMGAAIYFYIGNELLSVIENYGRLGLPLPDKLRNAVKLLRDRGGDRPPDDDPPSGDRPPS
ncbi:phage holin family protein [Cohnella zeiphila]|uniref:Phage holin family protein n=1 Tax=Cohnella zeiphila TaxID=2761120 RepID=A0A7X0SS22_9BACL|nr:phage holin family protein [Cohnella zeiphila]MBB6735034.1 phage holin family protein [Cohnella zeiphila]